MKRNLILLGCLFGLTIAVSRSPADERSTSEKGSADAILQVGLFEAMEKKLVEVKFIPRDAAQANVVFNNISKEPVDLELPDNFGAVHVLGQFAGGPGGGIGIGGGQGLGGPGGGGGGFGAGGGQGLGGGFGQGGGANGFGGNNGGGIGFGGGGNGGIGGGGNGRGFFRVEPGKPRKLAVQTVCLDHGKPDPNSRMKYALVPLEQLTPAKEVHELCRQLAAKKVSQNVAQAAAWNLANGLSWQELASINRVESQFTGNIKFFNARELKAAFALTESCTETHESLASTSSSDHASAGVSRTR